MSLGSFTPPAGNEGRLAYKWKVLISVVFGSFIVLLDTTVVNVAFRTLQQEFGASVSESQWIISIYIMALGVSTPLSGFLGDRYGMKRVFLGGLAIFLLGSLLCGLAPNLWVLIAARALQGVGGGIALPLGTALLFTAFPPAEQGVALGVFGIALVVAPALGPIVGGWLVDSDLWRWIFFINLPIGAIGLTMGARFLRNFQVGGDKGLDVWGLITSTLGFGSVLYAASIAAEQGWTSTVVVGAFAIGLISLAAFVLIELFVAKNPLLDLRLFKSSLFTNAAVVGWVSVVALFAAEFLLPLYLQILRGYSALETGLILLPLAISSGIVLPLAGRLYDRIGARPLMVAGFSLLAVNTWQLSHLTLETSLSWLVVLLILRGIALGLTVQTTLVVGLTDVPSPKLSRGSALVNSTRQVVQSIAVAFLATVLASAITPGLSARLEQFQAAVPAQALESSALGDMALCDLPDARGLPIPETVKQTIGQFCTEYVSGLERAYHYTFYAALVAIVIGAFLPGWPLAWEGRRARGAPGPSASH